MDPLVSIPVVCIDEECRDPALKLSTRQIADYGKTFAPAIIATDGVIQAGKVPRWFTLSHINGAFLVLLLSRFSGAERWMHAFCASCHEVKHPALPSGVMRAKASQVSENGMDQSVADAEWWNECVRKFGMKTCLTIGRYALALAELPADERGVFLSADGPAPTP